MSTTSNDHKSNNNPATEVAAASESAGSTSTGDNMTPPSVEEPLQRKSVEREMSMTVDEVFAHKNAANNSKGSGSGSGSTKKETIEGNGEDVPPQVVPIKKTQFSTQRTSSSLSASSHQIPENSADNTPIFSAGNPGSMPINQKILNRQASSNITFASQHELPRLPIPSLNETLNKFLVHLQALHRDDMQRNQAKKAVLEFLKGDGPKLQELLLQYDREGQRTGEIGSYVEEFWNDSYLAPDESVVLNLNPFFVLEDGPDPKTAKDPIRRAASLCFASIKLASELRNETLKPDVFRGKALCMDQFKALFSAARIPAHDAKDSIALYEKSNHVAVMCRSQLYYFQALWPEGDVAVDEGDLIDILGAIHSHADSVEDPVAASRSALGVLTSLPRNEWAQAREALIKHSKKNEESLRIVDSALFVMVLDEYVPKNVHNAASNMLHGSYHIQKNANYTDYQVGSCTNRWYDKLQIIVCGDGTAGINFEHSAIDGHTALRFVSDIYAETVISFAQSITKLVQAHDMIPSVISANVKRAATALDPAGRTKLDVFPKKIPFDVPSSVKEKIYFAETALGDQIVSSETHVLEFTQYGKLYIVGNKVSPDSYIQLSMMLAYYKLYGHMVCAYEPVMTKGFFHGRTEAMRPATMEAKQLCETFCNPSATRSQKEEALRHAAQVHSQLVKECARGKGVDRHLFALKCIAEKHGMPVPPFFNQSPWKTLNHTILSTSNCGNPSLRLFGFGPVVPDGLGIGYIIKDHGVHFAISSKHRQTKRYAHTLDCVLNEMGQLFTPKTSIHVPSEPSTSHPERGLDTGERRSLRNLPIAYDSYGDVWGESADHPTTKKKKKPRPSAAVATTPTPAGDGHSIDSASVSLTGSGDGSDGDVSGDFDGSSAILEVPDLSEPDGGQPQRVSVPAAVIPVVDVIPPNAPTPPPPPSMHASATPMTSRRSSTSSRWDPVTDVVAAPPVVTTVKPASTGGASLIDDDDEHDEEIVVPIAPVEDSVGALPPKLQRQKSNDSMPKVPARRGSMFNGVKREHSFEYKELSQKGINLQMVGYTTVYPSTQSKASAASPPKTISGDDKDSKASPTTGPTVAEGDNGTGSST